jgi:DNA-directed RNA polymerase subunit RPC12/RpoP
MGVMNLRAICPNCGGKIHTQPKGLGHLTWARSWFLVQTGTTCQHCGVALSGKVKADNKAELASEVQLRTQKNAAKTVGRQQRRVAKEAAARHAEAVAETHPCSSCGYEPEPQVGGLVRCPRCGELF